MHTNHFFTNSTEIYKENSLILLSFRFHFHNRFLDFHQNLINLHGFWLLIPNLQVISNFCWSRLEGNRDRIKLLRNLLLQWQSRILDNPCVLELQERNYKHSWTILFICFALLSSKSRGIGTALQERLEIKIRNRLNYVRDLVEYWL